jgi:hypothetical protein
MQRRTCRAGILKQAAIASILSLLSACSTTSLVADCCYDGEAALTRIEGVDLVMADGTSRPFTDVYAGFEPQSGTFTKPFDFRKVRFSLITYDALAVVLPLYDANDDGVLLEPEITVMYIREGAIGMGHSVDHLAVNGKRASAITVARADVGGLMSYIHAHRDQMTPESQAIFRDLERVGLDIRQEGSEGPDRQRRKIIP